MTVLYKVWQQLILFTAAHAVLCFGLVIEIALTPHPCFNCCYMTVTPHQSLLCLKLPLQQGVEEMGGHLELWHFSYQIPTMHDEAPLLQCLNICMPVGRGERIPSSFASTCSFCFTY